MTNQNEVKDKFYNDLDDFMSSIPRTDKLILLGNLFFLATEELTKCYEPLQKLRGEVMAM